jgi:hypothetical protein
MLGGMIPAAILLLVLGYAALRLFAGYPHPAAGRFKILAPREAAFLAAASDALFPPGGAIEASGSDAGIPQYVDRYVAALPARVRILMHLLFLLVEQATLVFPAPGPGGRRRFSSLDPEQRAGALMSWQRSRLFLRRLVFTSLRGILTMGYFGDPAVLRDLRLAPLRIETPVSDADLLYPPIGKGPEAIPYAAADRTPPSDGTPLDLDGPLHADFSEDPA